MIVTAAALTFASSDVASSAVLPPGTYHYTLYSDGKPAGKSTIVVKRLDGSLRIAETTTLQGDRIDTTRTIDPSTFSTIDYVLGAQGAQERIEIGGKGATNRSGANSKTLAPATPGPAIVFDFFVGEYVALPAMIHTATARAFNVYCLCFYGFEVKTSAIVPATASRPAGVPATAAEAAFDLDDATCTLWYDPVTFVLFELDVPKPRIRIVLIDGQASSPRSRAGSRHARNAKAGKTTNVAVRMRRHE